MKILLDIDDTICITSPLWLEITEKYMQQRGFLRKRKKDCYDIALSFKMSNADRQLYYRDMQSDFPYSMLTSVEGASEFIHKHLSAGDSVEFITARPMLKYSETSEWMQRHLFLSSPIVHYKDYIDELTPDLLIDNSVMRVRNAISKGIPAILFTGVYVEQAEGSTTKGLLKAKTFEKIEQFIKEIFENGRREEALRGEITLPRTRGKSKQAV